MTEFLEGYPFHLAGDPTDPPTPPAPRVLAMARRAAARLESEPVSYAAGSWRMAASLLVYRSEADAANPGRDRTSDGTIGDRRHQALGADSDHNPWLKVAGVGVCRAADLDSDGLDLATAFERGRALAAAGRLPQVTGGGYLIYNGKITSADFSTWRVYTGDNPHVVEGHVSVSRDPARFDRRDPWGIFTDAPAPTPPAPAPTPPTPAPQPRRDLTGRGQALRGAQGNSGPRVGQLQAFLNRYAPAYSHLVVDKVWGPATSRVIAEFAHRSSIGEADGLNIGPKIAGALWRAGFDRSAAQARALRHLAREPRR